MAAPNYDQGSCCVYEGWRFGSVRRKTRCWRKEDRERLVGGHLSNRAEGLGGENFSLQMNRCVVKRTEAAEQCVWCLM